MRHCLHLLWLACLWLAATYPATAGAAADSLHVSLITCGPGEEVYEVYGHTAIRVRNDSTGEDWAFNYGVFNFEQPHFIWRFVLGETDYQLGVAPFDYFVMNYAEDGRFVNEQVLNLDSDEKARLFAFLVANYLPENRVYRYNFFDKNCTTQARDIIEMAVNGEIRWPDNPPHSYRDLLHVFTAQDAWLRFGQDLLIGTEADQTLDTPGQDFLPLLLERDMAGAVIVDKAGNRRPAVTEARQLTPQAPDTETQTWFTPRKTALAWFVLALGVAVIQVVKRRNWWWFDIPFIALQGVAGCLITFLFFTSTHPGVDSNWLIAVLNPLPLLYLPWEIRRARRRRRDAYHIAAPAVIWAFTAFPPLTGQTVPAELLFFINGLALLSVARVSLAYLNKTNE